MPGKLVVGVVGDLCREGKIRGKFKIGICRIYLLIIVVLV